MRFCPHGLRILCLVQTLVVHQQVSPEFGGGGPEVIDVPLNAKDLTKTYKVTESGTFYKVLKVGDGSRARVDACIRATKHTHPLERGLETHSQGEEIEPSPRVHLRYPHDRHQPLMLMMATTAGGGPHGPEAQGGRHCQVSVHRAGVPG